MVYETGPRPGVTHQQIWILQGAMEITIGDERFDLSVGDCLAMILDQPVAFHNPTSRPTRYAVVLCTGPGAR